MAGSRTPHSRPSVSFQSTQERLPPDKNRCGATLTWSGNPETGYYAYRHKEFGYKDGEPAPVASAPGLLPRPRSAAAIPMCAYTETAKSEARRKETQQTTECLPRASRPRSNSVGVASNTAAFRWGSKGVVDPEDNFHGVPATWRDSPEVGSYSYHYKQIGYRDGPAPTPQPVRPPESAMKSIMRGHIAHWRATRCGHLRQN
eukprot:TRINITY_DN31904_c0_g1_i1.p1 TRINITY_DN31904_c0_g1~~TRINITY_DN31904_c0_g1_i1.p1  ORF type:complete len:218 (-),score=11.60 TRINITY_DN31904_c0_g1_i1:52-657(-)